MNKKTLKELAKELNLEDRLFPNGEILRLEERFGIVERNGKMKLIDLVSLARFNPITIGRQVSINKQGFNTLLAQLRIYKNQVGLTVRI